MRREDVLGNKSVIEHKGAALASGVAPSALDVAAIWKFILKAAEEQCGAAEKRPTANAR